MKQVLMVVSCAAMTGCAVGWQAIDYTPTALVANDPRAEAEPILLGRPFCMSKVTWTNTQLRAGAACTGANVVQEVADFTRVQRVVVKDYQGGSGRQFPLVVLQHTDGSPDFTWQVRTLDEAKKLADAFTALAKASTASIR